MASALRERDRRGEREREEEQRRGREMQIHTAKNNRRVKSKD